MRKINIYSTYYQDRNENRATELKMTTSFNLALPYTSFTIFIDNTDTTEINTTTKALFQYYIQLNKLRIVEKQGRPSFNDLLEQIALDSKGADPTDVFIIMNTDIFLYDLSQFVQLGGQNVAYAISRYDKINGKNVLFERADSQDTWVFFGKTDIKLPLQINFGTAGCDNRFAYEMEQQGYEVKNPAYSIITVHYHESGIRNYLNPTGEVTERIPPPYKLIPLT